MWLEKGKERLRRGDVILIKKSKRLGRRKSTAQHSAA